MKEYTSKELAAIHKKYSYVFPSLIDRRDIPYISGSAQSAPATLEANRGPILNQGSWGACTGYGTAGMLHTTFNRITGFNLNFSPTWLWWHARKAAGWPTENKGAYPRDIFKNLVNIGAVEAHAWKAQTVAEVPPNIEQTDVVKFKGYKRFNLDQDFDSVKNDFYWCIGTERLPIGINMAVVPSFEMQTSESGILEYHEEPIVGYHWVYVDGVDDDGITLVNSWSSNWGNNGTAKMSWEYARHRLVEAWTLDPKLP